MQIKSISIGAFLLRSWPQFTDPRDFPLDATDFAVKNLIPRASLVLLGGKPATFKSYLALYLAKEIASGGEFLGRACAKMPVLYLDKENRRQTIANRLD